MTFSTALWRKIVDRLDHWPGSLGLEPGAARDEITRAYRSLTEPVSRDAFSEATGQAGIPGAAQMA